MIKILIVDDSPCRVDKIIRSIKASWFHGVVDVSVAVSADSARNFLRHSFDLLVLDVMLPKKNDGVPSAKHGLDLLEDFSRRQGRYIRPKLVIGVTANLEDIHAYQDEFSKMVSVVLNGSIGSNEWLATLIENIDGLASAEKAIFSSSINKRLITVHGIRTYGSWQQSIENAMKGYSREFEFLQFRYGFLDIFSFLIPFLRKRKMKEVADRLRSVLVEDGEFETFVIGHSFGSMIVSEAFKALPNDRSFRMTILCGSPLNSKDDIGHIIESSQFTVNECGTRDYILVLARLFGVGLGDAGRVGFAREETKRFKNRFFRGGHSLYFNKESTVEFFEEYWVPLLCAGKEPEHVDFRENYIGEDLVEASIRLFSSVKVFFYVIVFLVVVFSFF